MTETHGTLFDEFLRMLRQSGFTGLGDHHGIRCSRSSSRTLEQGKDSWSEGALQAQHLQKLRQTTTGNLTVRAPRWWPDLNQTASA